MVSPICRLLHAVPNCRYTAMNTVEHLLLEFENSATHSSDLCDANITGLPILKQAGATCI